jgi:hypothetical protein
LHWLGWLQYFACFLQCILQWWTHFLLWLRKMCIWLHKGYVGYRKIWWVHGCTTPPCLHWYICTNSAVPGILLCTSFLGRGRTFSYNPSLLFFSPAQEVLPLTNLSSLKKKY